VKKGNYFDGDSNNANGDCILVTLIAIMFM